MHRKTIAVQPHYVIFTRKDKITNAVIQRYDSGDPTYNGLCFGIGVLRLLKHISGSPVSITVDIAKQIQNAWQTGGIVDVSRFPLPVLENKTARIALRKPEYKGTYDKTQDQYLRPSPEQITRLLCDNLHPVIKKIPDFLFIVADHPFGEVTSHAVYTRLAFHHDFSAKPMEFEFHDAVWRNAFNNRDIDPEETSEERETHFEEDFAACIQAMETKIGPIYSLQLRTYKFP